MYLMVEPSAVPVLVEAVISDCRENGRIAIELACCVRTSLDEQTAMGPFLDSRQGLASSRLEYKPSWFENSITLSCSASEKGSVKIRTRIVSHRYTIA